MFPYEYIFLPCCDLLEQTQYDKVGKLRERIGPKDFLDCECNCISTTKVRGECAYKGECRSCCLVYKITCKLFLSVYLVNKKNTLKKIGIFFQDVAQKVQHYKHSDTFAAHFAQHFDQKPTQQHCREIMKF